MNTLTRFVSLLLLTLFSATAFAITDAQVFAYAEANYSSLFSGTPAPGRYDKYDYRYYPASKNYLAVDTSGDIYILGPNTGNTVTYVGPVSAFAKTIAAWEATQSAPPSDPAWFVSPGGNDANPGTTPASPFATFERARSAMQGSSIKTTYLMAGTYPMKSTFILDHNDNGESWLAYPGQTPVLDGGKTVKVAIEMETLDNITIRWLTIKNFNECGIKGRNVSGIIIDSNTFKDIASWDWGQASVELGGSIKKGKITHNLIEGAGYAGIEINAAAGNDINNLLIDGNVVHDACRTKEDCGGIYVMDRAYASTGVTITNNVIGNYGNTNQVYGIYLDDQLSNVTVKGNVVYGTGSASFQIHGGDHNTFTNNIFDISKVPALGLYGDISTSTENLLKIVLPNYGMAGNTFQCNIVYSSSVPPPALWDYNNEGLIKWGTIMIIEKPSVSANVYWGANRPLPNAGDIRDSNPTLADPLFVDPLNADYHFKSGPPTSCFVPIDMTNVGPLPH